LRQWQQPELAETTQLIVSELVTNSLLAMRATGWPVRRSSMRLWLLSDQASALIQVWDPIPAPPVLGDARTDDESGRGLLIVTVLSQAWDFYPDPVFGGKVTWALVTTP
jgi:hypothetical protein